MAKLDLRDVVTLYLLAWKVTQAASRVKRVPDTVEIGTNRILGQKESERVRGKKKG